MKKVLLISDNKIFGIGGGSLEEHKYYDGIKNYVSTHGGEFRILSIDDPSDESLTEKIEKSRHYDLLARLLGHSTYMYFVWKKYKKRVLEYKPDIIFLGRSRMGFIARDVRKLLPDTKVVCNMENVEYDYVDGYFSDNKSFLKTLYIAWEKFCVKRDESKAVQYAHAVDYLTKRDYKRTHEFYKVPENAREMILPICIENATQLCCRSDNRNVVFIGSLGYRANSMALKSFLDNVWNVYYSDRKDVSLIVGGRNPDEELEKKVLSVPNCSFHKNFSSLEDIIPMYSLVIAPIEKGAGMKVKVAETLSMGLMIAASDEALVGYESALDSKSAGIIRANTSEDYRKAIDAYLQLTSNEMERISLEQKKLYRNNYSYDISKEAISDLIDDLLR